MFGCSCSGQLKGILLKWDENLLWVEFPSRPHTCMYSDSEPKDASGTDQQEKPGSPQEDKLPEMEVAKIPEAPQIPSPDREESGMEGTMSNSALVRHSNPSLLFIWKDNNKPMHFKFQN